MEMLGASSDTYTFVSDAHQDCRRWLDHCLVTESAWQSVAEISVLHDIFWSDHLPLIIKCNLECIKPKLGLGSDYSINTIAWGERDTYQISNYKDFCDLKLKSIEVPTVCKDCCDNICRDLSHRIAIDMLYDQIIQTLREASMCSYSVKKHRKRYITGWNKHVKDAHGEARLGFQEWILNGKPSEGPFFTRMIETRKIFKSRLKWCQNNQQQLKMDIIASHHSAKNFAQFWKQTNCLNPKPTLPVSVEGKSAPSEIANLFKKHFQVLSPLGRSERVSSAGSVALTVRFDARDVADVITHMKRGKSPGHDGLSIEHLLHAGGHLPRVLAILFNLCVSHSYLPLNLMKTIVVPIIKNKTGIVSDIQNYRPISLATVVAKVLDSLLDKHLERHIILDDAQFGFQAGLSTESAILCLKSTVQYYTTRNTPVYACFLDLSKAFDLVAYDILWNMMVCDTGLPAELIEFLSSGTVTKSTRSDGQVCSRMSIGWSVVSGRVV
ncbi:uncharacterized protein [Choristoneura fumiferana]|uniref:uncharacterized protein n=1 Tax=Choristoneura fumiferana TaxID=7141 RepID=UPI003D154D48